MIAAERKDVGIPPVERISVMLTRTAHMTAAIVSAALLVVYVTVLPVPAHASAPAVTATAAN